MANCALSLVTTVLPQIFRSFPFSTFELPKAKGHQRPMSMIVRPLNGLMDKGHEGIGDGDPSLAWLTPHQAPTSCLPQLGNMPQARCMLHYTEIISSALH